MFFKKSLIKNLELSCIAFLMLANSAINESIFPVWVAVILFAIIIVVSEIAFEKEFSKNKKLDAILYTDVVFLFLIISIFVFVLPKTNIFVTVLFIVNSFFLALGIILLIKVIVERLYTRLQVIFAGLIIYISSAIYFASGYILFPETIKNSTNYISNGFLENIFEYIYFSFTTISTVGYGDLSVANPWGKILVIIEITVGLFITGVIIAGAISLPDSIEKENMTKRTAKNRKKYRRFNTNKKLKRISRKRKKL